MRTGKQLARRRAAPAADCGPGCACNDFVAGVLADVDELAALGGRRGRAVRRLARAHRSGGISAALGDLGELDASAWFPDRTDIDAETEAFDGRLNSFLLDYEATAATLAASFVQQVDDYTTRWRTWKDSLYIIGRTRMTELLTFEGDFNRLRDQFLEMGHTTAIEAATVTVDGATVRSDQLPASAAGASLIDSLETAAKWGGLVLVGGLAVKLAVDFGLFKRLGRAVVGGGAG